MRILGFEIKMSVKNLADEPPQLNRRHYHKDNDDRDMIAYVVPKEIVDDGKTVRYIKIYKSGYHMYPALDQCGVREFNQYYKSR